ncbi:MAG: methyltransferase domain-containing protein [Kiritimatiellae bacterium]|jgi:2-polyprenyl-3-methyl-5-hydroxy-6-metoxy-1,4-benzoquinol methylase|nr:methyltransferase domain-containing protein [Kiritimatiellia bacterium]MDD4341169.1 methyltransferase domain-containing protein [Kiritimatiellia bacterium]
MNKIKTVLENRLRRFATRRGFDLYRSASIPAECVYHEREEFGPSNLQVKLDRVKQGRPFENPDILALNQVVCSLLESEKRIVEFGSGTGMFARMASEDPGRYIVASEFDQPTWQWCLDHIAPRSNVRFVNGPCTEKDGPFDAVVAIEVIEHIADYRSFLEQCAGLAPRALFTTPNRRRDAKVFTAGPPPYPEHVREWTAGEFYWVLRCFWNEVRLYGMPNAFKPQCLLIDVNATASPLIADCRNPWMPRGQRGKE